MRPERRRVLAPLAAAGLALALGFAACGGGSDSVSSTSATAAGASAPTPSTSAPAKSGGGKPSLSGSSGPTRAGSSSGAARAFETHGGDNSIQEFGTETGGSELARAAAALHAYLDARTAERWARACSYMTSGVTESLRPLAGAAKGAAGDSQKVGCPQLLAALSADMPAYLRHELRQAEVGALRVKGTSAFLLFRGAHHTDYFMPMATEAGEWKVAALAASALP